MTNTAPAQQLALPAAAQSRISHTTQGRAAATAFLTYADYVGLRQLGFEPMAGVIGISVVHLGRGQLTGMKQAQELEVYSHAIGMGLFASMGRLQEEAALLGADGVLVRDVEIRRISEEHEYHYSGTALRFTPRPGALRTTSGLPFLYSAPRSVAILYSGSGVERGPTEWALGTNTAVMSLYQMMKLDMVPVTCGYGVCVYHVPHRSMRQALGQMFQNTEVPQFTEAWYTAREIAMSRLQSYLEQQGSELVVDMEVTKEADFFGEHTVEFRVRGMGWRHAEGVSAILPAVDLRPSALIERGLQVIGADGAPAVADALGATVAAPPVPPPPPPPPPDTSSVGGGA